MILRAALLWLLTAGCALAQLPMTQVAIGKATAVALTISCPPTGSTSSSITCTGTYTSTAPATTGWTYSWNSTCTGSGSVTSVASVSGGSITGIVVPTPSGACTGTVTLTTNIPTSGTSGAVVISAGFQGIGNAWSGALYYHSCTNGYSAASAATGTEKSCNLGRNDGHTCDILIATNGTLGNTENCNNGGDNGEAIATWMSGHTALVITAYDHVNNLDVTFSSGHQPAFSLTSGSGASPSMVFDGSTTFGTANNPLLSSPATIIAVYNQTFNSTQQILVDFNAGSFTIVPDSTSNNIICSGGGAGNTHASATNSAWHVVQCVFTGGANTLTNVDGVSGTPGTVGAVASSSASTIGALSGGSQILFFLGGFTEDAGWASAATSGNLSAVCTNAVARGVIPGPC